MQPITQNITFVRGDTLQFDVHLTDVEATVESMFFSAKKSATDTEYAFQKSLDDGITLVDENVYRVRVAPEDTAQLTAGTTTQPKKTRTVTKRKPCGWQRANTFPDFLQTMRLTQERCPQ